MRLLAGYLLLRMCGEPQRLQGLDQTRQELIRFDSC